MTTIKSIKKMTNYGIFRDYLGNQSNEFGKKNLFYGWNGSGKTTLGTLFRGLELKAIDSRFTNADFSVELEDTIVTKDNLNEATIIIKTFNDDFVKANIDWDKSVKGILLISDEKIEDKQKLDKLQLEYNTDQTDFNLNLKKSTDLTDSISKFLTDSAKRIKTSFQVIDTSDTYYLNYDRTKFKKFLDSNKDNVRKENATLKNPDVVKITKAAKPEQKPNLSLLVNKLNPETISTTYERLSDLLKTSAINTAIDRLSNNSDIQDWVGEGLKIHANHSSQNCEFCGSKITPDRKKELEGHFNLEYIKLQERLNLAEEWLKNQLIDLPSIVSEGEPYEEFKSDLTHAISQLKIATSELNSQILLWQNCLTLKKANQFDINISVTAIPDAMIDNFNSAVAIIEQVVTKHNNKTADFEEETKRNKQLLELHYAASESKNFDYYTKTESEANLKTELEEKQKKLNENIDTIKKIELSLSNAGIGAIQFNDALHRFLGRTELSLNFRPEKGGYEIIRNGSGEHDSNLSEGERTAIAFIYFITKLSENNNKIDNTIVVVDDPVSSFDSNHLFHAYSYLRTHCENAKQLFVLTHNFNFYKLVRDWFYGINENRKKKNKEPVCFFYAIESDTKKPRSSIIKNADDSLTRYQSEYHYLFSKLYSFKNKTSLTMEEAFLCANISRKLLETFLAFKYPKNRNNLSDLMSDGLEGCKLTTVEVKEKIYRFINKYSHSVIIELSQDGLENLYGESVNVIEDIFNWMNEVDSVHFKEMSEVAITNVT